MTHKTRCFLMFLIGLWSQTEIRIIGSLAISEAALFLIAPFIWLLDFDVLRRDGFNKILGLLVASAVGCAIASYMNDTIFPSFLKGVAALYATWCAIVVFHRILRGDYNCLGWFFLGVFISGIICIFVFQKGVDGSELGADAAQVTEKIVNGPIFWIGKLNAALKIPINGWYLQTPVAYSVFVPIALAAHAMLTSVSGRSAALGALAGAVVAFIGRRSQKRMALISKHFLGFVILGLVCVFLAKQAYTTLAANGTLGEETQKKFYNQTKGRTDVLSILIGGRAEFFVGLIAAFEKPIVGYGPWALDYDDIYGKFVLKYGDSEDIESYIKWKEYSNGSYSLLRAHSHIIQFWHYYGIFGLIFWLYAFYLFYSYFKKYIAVYPPWFGFLAIGIPGSLWGVFFSPYGNRITWGLLFTCLLYVKAMYEGRIPVPYCKTVEK